MCLCLAGVCGVCVCARALVSSWGVCVSVSSWGVCVCLAGLCVYLAGVCVCVCV